MDKYGLIGFPLAHSLSKEYFNTKFKSEGINAQYENFEISNIEELRAVLLTNPSLRGLNVTLPYKRQVIPYLQELSKEAKAIGAVNVIKITRTGKKTYLKGYNSDVGAFLSSIRPLIERHHKKALILGTGGAARAVEYGLHSIDIETRMVSREKKTDGTLTYGDLSPDIMDEYKIVVNCTPVGMFPNIDDYPNIPYASLTKQHLLYDMIYNPDETAFLTKGKQQGALTKNGIEMLLLQAFATWEYWQQ